MEFILIGYITAIYKGGGSRGLLAHVYMYMYMYMYRYTYMYMYMYIAVCLSLVLSLDPSIHLPNYPSTCLSLRVFAFADAELRIFPVSMLGVTIFMLAAECSISEEEPSAPDQAAVKDGRPTPQPAPPLRVQSIQL